MHKPKEELDLSKIENDEYGKKINNDDENEIMLQFITNGILFFENRKFRFKRS